MATFVLVAGAWHGGWCWKRVRPLLQEAGHEVYTPTLTGSGERVHLASPEIDLDTHITDVVNGLEYEDLTDVLLVGHSYGGLVIGTAAHRVPERIGHLIYLDALLPEDGKTANQLYESNGQQAFVERVMRIVEEEGEGWYWPPPSPDAPNLRVTDPDDQAWMASKLTPHPIGTSYTVMRLDNPAAERIPRSFIACPPYPPGGLIPHFARQAREDPSWTYYEFETSHDPMITDPETLAEILIEIAA